VRLPDSKRVRIVAFGALAAVLGAWLVLVIRQVADGGFYSDDWGVQWAWDAYGYWGAVEDEFRILGSKPLLAIVIFAPYELLGSDPAVHHALAAALVLATIAAFYLVLRRLRFQTRDAVPIALLALLFPWATGIRLWPAGSLNNLAVLLLFGGFLLALRGLRVPGPVGLLIHLLAAACYAAAILTYDATTAVALILWPAYVWLRGWRPALPRAAMDITAAGAAALYTAANTQKDIVPFSDQLAHLPEILREGADLIAATLAPVSVPAGFPAALTALVLGVALALLIAASVRSRTLAGGAGLQNGRHWVTVAAVALAALAGCWSIYLPQAFYTPTFQGLEDRVNVLALYPAAVLVWAVLRAAGSLIPGRGYLVAIAGSAIIAGYWVQDLRQQRDWVDAAERQEAVLAAVERASPRDRSLVLTFGHPAQVAPRLPVFNQSWDLWPAAQLRTESEIEAYPVFRGARLRCSPKGVSVEFLATPFYRVINLNDRETPKTTEYSSVVFVDVATGRHAVIRSPEQCAKALPEFESGPWLANPASR
jgi:hypothetical protein